MDGVVVGDILGGHNAASETRPDTSPARRCSGLCLTDVPTVNIPVEFRRKFDAFLRKIRAGLPEFRSVGAGIPAIKPMSAVLVGQLFLLIDFREFTLFLAAVETPGHGC